MQDSQDGSMSSRRDQRNAAAVLEPGSLRPFSPAPDRGRRPVAEHQACVRGIIRPRPPRLAPLDAAEGRVLAADVTAVCPLPAFDNSAVDGYAVASADVVTAGPQSPAVLPVLADIPAGRGDGGPLDPGTVHRIMTGAPIPSGADAVIPVESTDGGLRNVSVTAFLAPGSNIRRRGEDIQPGASALEAGTVLGPAQLGLLSALGQEQVLIRPALRVLLISTGSELSAQGTVPGTAQVRDANTIMLAAAVRACGAVVQRSHVVSDDASELVRVIVKAAPDIDLILTSGGISAGAYEPVKQALGPRGVEFTQVAMQPGRPQGAGLFCGIPVVALPGNPVSAFISFEVFLRPALRGAMGFDPPERPTAIRRLANPVDSRAGVHQFRLGVPGPGGTFALLSGHRAHFLSSAARSPWLLEIPPDVTHLPAGASCAVRFLN
jgi:molybdopterin molybdotransferase